MLAIMEGFQILFGFLLSLHKLDEIELFNYVSGVKNKGV